MAEKRLIDHGPGEWVASAAAGFWCHGGMEHNRQSSNREELALERGDPAKARQAKSAREFQRQVVSGLHPKLREMYERLPPEISGRVAKLVEKNEYGRKINPNRLVKYAVLRVVAERQIGEAATSETHAERARGELLGQRYGFEEGYEKPERASRLDGADRQARQRIETSLGSVSTAFRRAQRVIQRNLPQLPVAARESMAESVKSMDELLVEMQRCIRYERHPHSRHTTRPRTESELTFALWLWLISNYKGKWDDMAELAYAWKLTRSSGTDAFRVIAIRAFRRLNSISVPFGTRWISVLSEDF